MSLDKYIYMSYWLKKKKKTHLPLLKKKKKKNPAVHPHFSHTNNFKLLPNKFKSPNYHPYVFLWLENVV